MDFLKTLLDYVLHLNTHLDGLVAEYGAWVYAILFVIVFCETGLVVTPFLPGDSLLFAVGAIAGLPDSKLNLFIAMAVLLVAAILGDTVNYWVGNMAGHKLVEKFPRLIKKQHLDRTHEFFERYGGKTIIIARFMPIIRTFAPFVAGMGRMNYASFTAYNIVGGLIWIFFFVIVGFYFGNLPAVKKNFTLVIMGIIVLSMMPPVIEYLRHRFSKKPAQPS